MLRESGVRTLPGAHGSELMMRFIGGSGRFRASGSGRVKQVRSRAFHLEVQLDFALNILWDSLLGFQEIIEISKHL